MRLSAVVKAVGGWPISSLFGILAVILYLTFTFISYLHYSEPYGPLSNSLSSLGNPEQNPSGAIFYNAGCILLGVALIPFYLGLRRWNTGENRMKILLTTAQVTGVLSSLSLILSAVFPSGASAAHGFWAGMLFLSMALFWVLSAFSLLRHPASIRWMAYYGYLVIIVIIAAGVFPEARTAGEWATVALFMGYVVMLSHNTRVISKILSSKP